jgi:hypothetical protein
MSWTKKIIIALACGCVIASSGLFLVYVGGYGSCGPAGIIATIGAFLTIYHFTPVFALFPFVATWDSPFFNVCYLILVPAIDWSIVVFILLTLGSRLRRIKGKK